ncbi:MAG TPA: hypothetical protein VEY88_25805 [Archangium sp.]|nr:hypothetical protein [Archangium sp.]
MKLFLGALTAAAVLGIGCAHNREASRQTEPPPSPQASVERPQQVPGYMCQVIDSAASGTTSGPAQSQSTTLESESQGGAVSGGAVSGDALEDNAIGGSALEEGAAPEEGTVLGGAQQDNAPKDTATSGAAPQKDTFDDTGMGGGGGGGG